MVVLWCYYTRKCLLTVSKIIKYYNESKVARQEFSIRIIVLRTFLHLTIAFRLLKICRVYTTIQLIIFRLQELELVSFLEPHETCRKFFRKLRNR